jgi:hypothetical protein
MKELVLQARPLGEAEARTLEERGLVSFLRHPDPSVRRGLASDYFKGPDFRADKKGFHSVTITYTEIFLSSHPKGQDEIVFMWDALGDFRPLFFVFALDKREGYLRKLKAGGVAADDYLALRVPYNDPRYSSFIVRPETVHCELTDRRGPAEVYPSFFVLEPTALKVQHTEETKHGVQLRLQP